MSTISPITPSANSSDAGAHAAPVAAPVASTPFAPARRDWWPVAASAAFSSAWLVGLAAFPAAPGADVTDAEVAAFYAQHPASTALQSVLVHGVAAVAMAGLLLALARRRTTGRLALAAGSFGVALSLVQCALGVWRSTLASAATTSQLVAAIDRIDGAKMLALALLLAAGTVGLRRSGTFGRVATAVGVTGAAALVAAGTTYAIGAGALAAAAIALLALLTWVGATGWAVAARGR